MFMSFVQNRKRTILMLIICCETQLGYKMVKYLRSIEFVADYRTIGEGQGGSARIFSITARVQRSKTLFTG